MPWLKVTMDLEADPWADLKEREVIHLGNDSPAIRVGAIPGGMKSGKASVALCIELPDGNIVVAETTLALFLMAADALRARYGDNEPRGTDA